MLEEECAVCLQPISNPVCERCYLKQIDAWLKQIHVTMMPRAFILNHIRKNTSFDTLSDVRCVLCGRENVSVCSYCFFDKVANILRGLNLSEEFIQTFHASFNYVESYDAEVGEMSV